MCFKGGICFSTLLQLSYFLSQVQQKCLWQSSNVAQVLRAAPPPEHQRSLRNWGLVATVSTTKSRFCELVSYQCAVWYGDGFFFCPNAVSKWCAVAGAWLIIVILFFDTLSLVLTILLILYYVFWQDDCLLLIVIKIIYPWFDSIIAKTVKEKIDSYLHFYNFARILYCYTIINKFNFRLNKKLAQVIKIRVTTTS